MNSTDTSTSVVVVVGGSVVVVVARVVVVVLATVEVVVVAGVVLVVVASAAVVVVSASVESTASSEGEQATAIKATTSRSSTGRRTPSKLTRTRLSARTFLDGAGYALIADPDGSYGDGSITLAGYSTPTMCVESSVPCVAISGGTSAIARLLPTTCPYSPEVM